MTVESRDLMFFRVYAGEELSHGEWAQRNCDELYDGEGITD